MLEKSNSNTDTSMSYISKFGYRLTISKDTANNFTYSIVKDTINILF